MFERKGQLAIAIGVIALGIVFAIGATQLPNDGGYAGIGPNFVPWVISFFLLLVGSGLALQALRGGFANFKSEVDDTSADKRGAMWVSAGILLMALLVTRIGFVPAATILFVCAARGFGSTTPLRDALIGAAISFPVFWLFTLVLDVNLPRLINDWL